LAFNLPSERKKARSGPYPTAAKSRPSPEP
jgi:hypothetical protein